MATNDRARYLGSKKPPQNYNLNSTAIKVIENELKAAEADVLLAEQEERDDPNNFTRRMVVGARERRDRIKADLTKLQRRK